MHVYTEGFSCFNGGMVIRSKMFYEMTAGNSMTCDPVLGTSAVVYFMSSFSPFLSSSLPTKDWVHPQLLLYSELQLHPELKPSSSSCPPSSSSFSPSSCSISKLSPAHHLVHTSVQPLVHYPSLISSLSPVYPTVYIHIFPLLLMACLSQSLTSSPSHITSPVQTPSHPAIHPKVQLLVHPQLMLSLTPSSSPVHSPAHYIFIILSKL